MRRVVLLCCLAFVLSFAIGCDEGPETHNFTYIFNSFDGDFGTVFNVDPTADVSTFTTYALELDADEKDTLATKQLAWLAAGSLEDNGYRRVEAPDAADLVLRLSVSNEYREQYIPPQEYTENVWVPAKEIEVEVDSHRRKVTVPAHEETRTAVKPARIEGAYYPTVSLQALDASRLRAGADPADTVIWEGRVTGRASLENVVLTGQFLLYRALARFPPRRGAADSTANLPPGRVGFDYVTATPDGISFYPCVLSAEKGSPAERAGLRRWDLIVAIDGVSTANVRTSEFLKRLRGAPGMQRYLTLRRPKGEKTVAVKLVTEAELTKTKR